MTDRGNLDAVARGYDADRGIGMTTREELHKLIDTLADEQIAEVRQYIYELRGEGVDAIRAYFSAVWENAATRFRLVAENTPGRASERDD